MRGWVGNEIKNYGGDKGKEKGGLQGEGNAELVCKPAENRGCDSTDPHGKTQNQPRSHGDVSRHKRLAHGHGDRIGRYDEKPREGEEDEGKGARGVKEKKKEGGG